MCWRSSASFTTPLLKSAERPGRGTRSQSLSLSRAGRLRQYARTSRTLKESLHRRIQDATLKRLDRAFAAFHRRAQAGEAPGHPRFKSSRRWKTLEMYSGNARCVFVDESTGKGLVRIKGLPVLRFRDKRVPPGIQPLQILVSRRPNGVYLYFVFDHLEAKPRSRM